MLVILLLLDLHKQQNLIKKNGAVLGGFIKRRKSDI